MAGRKKKTEENTEKKQTKRAKDIKIGDVVELQNDHHCMCADFHKGDRVLVTGLGEKGFSINNNPEYPEMGFEMIECGLEL